MILEVKNLAKYYPLERGIFKTHAGFIKAVDGVSFCLHEGEILGIVGESGCGKSTLAKLLLKLIEPTGGEITFWPPVLRLRLDAGIVFQDPLLSLDPRMRIRDILREPLLAQRKNADGKKVSELLAEVGLDTSILRRFPSQESGGQRQRVCIARSLATHPKLLILDEALSSLDTITQKHILELLTRLQSRLKLTYIFISHNIAVVKRIASRVIVMLEGKIVEQGSVDAVFSHPQAVYTKKLLEAAR